MKRSTSSEGALCGVLCAEETSLVARPAVKFGEIQARLERRLEHLGIKVTRIEEDE